MNVSAALARAAQFHAQGNLPAAQAEAANALASAPDDLTALRFAGALYCQAGDPGRGAPLLGKALSQHPADLQTRVNLIQALSETGDLEGAERIGQEAAGDSSPLLLRARSAVARKLGKTSEAVTLLEQAVTQSANDWAIWNNLGNALEEAGQPDRALYAFEKARSLSPRSTIVHLNLGRTLAAAGRLDESARAFADAAELDPGDGAAIFEHGKMLLELGHPEPALPLLSSAARIRRTDPEVFVAIGATYSLLNNLAQAEQAYRIALHVDPTFAPGYLNIAILLDRSNRLAEIEALYEEAISNGVPADSIAFIQAMVLRRKGELQEALQTAERAPMLGLDPAWREQFIGEVADKLGDVDKAFTAYSAMNAISGSYPNAINLDRSQYSRSVAAYETAISPEWVESWRPIDIALSPPSPAFLVGFFRSGTTLLDTILMGHDQTVVLEEEPMLASVEDALGDRQRVAALSSADANALRERYFRALLTPVPSGKLLIDKNPFAMLRAPLIQRLFPDSRIIFTLRHPCDVVLSCFMQNFQVTELMASFLDLENGARMYDAAMSYWKKAGSILPLNVHEIRYEDLIEDVEGQIRPLLDFLGLPWDDKVLDHQSTAVSRGYIRTPSYAQVTEKIYRRASGRWTRYREHLKDALPILEPWVREFGYSMD